MHRAQTGRCSVAIHVMADSTAVHSANCRRGQCQWQQWEWDVPQLGCMTSRAQFHFGRYSITFAQFVQHGLTWPPAAPAVWRSARRLGAMSESEQTVKDDDSLATSAKCGRNDRVSPGPVDLTGPPLERSRSVGGCSNPAYNHSWPLSAMRLAQSDICTTNLLRNLSKYPSARADAETESTLEIREGTGLSTLSHPTTPRKHVTQTPHTSNDHATAHSTRHSEWLQNLRWAVHRASANSTSFGCSAPASLLVTVHVDADAAHLQPAHFHLLLVAVTTPARAAAGRSVLPASAQLARPPAVE